MVYKLSSRNLIPKSTQIFTEIGFAKHLVDSNYTNHNYFAIISHPDCSNYVRVYIVYSSSTSGMSRRGAVKRINYVSPRN